MSQFAQTVRNSASKYNMGSSFLQLQDGENRVRLVSKFRDYGKHYDPSVKKYYTCTGYANGCEVCVRAIEAQQAGDKDLFNALKSRPAYLGWVIDRNDGEIKKVEFSWSIMKGITTLAESADWGFELLPHYDINIVKRAAQKAGQKVEYQVMPSKVVELTPEEQAKVKALDNPDEIVKKMVEKNMTTITIGEGEEGVGQLTEEEKASYDKSAEQIPF